MSRAHNIAAEYRPKPEGCKVFGIDFDDTYTAAPSAFDLFIRALVDGGHTAVFVTFRDGDCSDIIQVADRLGVGMIASDGKPKHDAAESHGVTVDVWIDDMPWLVYEGAT